MSQANWPILGYGIKLNWERIMEDFDLPNIAELLLDKSLMKQEDIDTMTSGDDDEIKELLDECEVGIDDLLIALTQNHQYLDWANTGDMYDERDYYLYLSAVAPWQQTGIADLTIEQVQDEIIGLLSPYLAGTVDTKKFRVWIEDISDVGCA